MTIPPLVDIHCHLLPGIDDGARSLDEAIVMARMAVEQGVETVICTPHQLGGFQNRGGDIRQRTSELQQLLHEHNVPLQVLPGADVRIEPDMIAGLDSGDVLSLGDRRKHVLLELPHELYFPLEGVLEQLGGLGMIGILSHPERNQGLLRDRVVVEHLVDQGCLMQVTAGSLAGTFGPHSQEMAQWMVDGGLVHFVATDAHGSQSRRPLLGRAFAQLCELHSEQAARLWCSRNPQAVADGEDVVAGRFCPSQPQRRAEVSATQTGWFRWKASS